MILNSVSRLVTKIVNEASREARLYSIGVVSGGFAGCDFVAC